jgi:sortase A
MDLIWRYWHHLVATVMIFVLVGCAQAGASPVVESVPVGLPAGEEGIARVSENAPPLGRPSLGTQKATTPDRLELPSIGVDTEVVTIGWQLVTQRDGTTYSEWEVADNAAGWHKNSALPGETGNVVLSGHNNIRGAVFRKLYTLGEGDLVYLWAGGQRFTYQVAEVMILEEKFASMEQRRENAKWIQPFDDKRLTLVSCWPETDNTHRVIVVAHQVDE